MIGKSNMREQGLVINGVITSAKNGTGIFLKSGEFASCYFIKNALKTLSTASAGNIILNDANTHFWSYEGGTVIYSSLDDFIDTETPALNGSYAGLRDICKLDSERALAICEVNSKHYSTVLSYNGTKIIYSPLKYFNSTLLYCYHVKNNLVIDSRGDFYNENVVNVSYSFSKTIQGEQIVVLNETRLVTYKSNKITLWEMNHTNKTVNVLDELTMATSGYINKIGDYVIYQSVTSFIVHTTNNILTVTDTSITISPNNSFINEDFALINGAISEIKDNNILISSIEDFDIYKIYKAGERVVGVQSGSSIKKTFTSWEKKILKGTTGIAIQSGDINQYIKTALPIANIIKFKE